MRGLRGARRAVQARAASCSTRSSRARWSSARTQGSTRAAMWGELLSTHTRARGGRGAIIDGLTRDAWGIADIRVSRLRPRLLAGRLEGPPRRDRDPRADRVRRGARRRRRPRRRRRRRLPRRPARRSRQEVVERALAKVEGENMVREVLAAGASIRQVFREHGISDLDTDDGGDAHWASSRSRRRAARRRPAPTRRGSGRGTSSTSRARARSTRPRGPSSGRRSRSRRERTLENVRAVLEAAGASMADVVKATVHLADIGDFAALQHGLRAALPRPEADAGRPSRACSRGSWSRSTSSPIPAS